jgi:hypothetical protein
VAVVSADLGDLFFVALDAPKGADIVSVDEALLPLLRLRVSETRGESAQNKLPGDIHLLLNGDIIPTKYSFKPTETILTIAHEAFPYNELHPRDYLSPNLIIILKSYEQPICTCEITQNNGGYGYNNNTPYNNAPYNNDPYNTNPYNNPYGNPYNKPYQPGPGYNNYGNNNYGYRNNQDSGAGDCCACLAGACCACCLLEACLR